MKPTRAPRRVDKYAPIFETAHQIGIVPLVWLSALWAGGARPAPIWWGIASAFAVSWAADWVSHWAGTFPVGPPYVVVQSGLLAFLLVPRPIAWRFGFVLLGAGLLALTRFDLQAPDIFVHTVAWLGLLAIVWPEPMSLSLRATLTVAFGLGWLAWMGYCLRPGWTSWLTYQGVRATSLLLFCGASTRRVYANA
jgi:hypothetical protein